MADWVSAHSHSQAQDDMDDLQQRANKIIQQKQLTRPERSGKKGLKSIKLAHEDSEQEMDVPLATKGVRHLKRLGLVPEKFGPRTEKEEMARAMDEGRGNPLKASFNVDRLVEGSDVDSIGARETKVDCGCGAHLKVTSGKFAKSNVNIIRQETWPHTAVSKKYIKRTSFDSMEFEAFVAGETKILYNMLLGGDPDVRGRLRVLTQVAHWMGKIKNWPTIRALYEAIIEEVEMGESEWGLDFSGYETMLPTVVQGGLSGVVGSSGSTSVTTEKNS